jgi:formate dehydrogenase subunit gamma
MVSFTMLCVTGLPQKYHQVAWGQALLGFLGGIQQARVIHHLFAAMFLFEGVYHVAVVVFELIFARRKPLGMVPGLQDVRDGLGSVAYLAGLRKEGPRYDRYDFKQKVEYWAMIWGTFSMGVTGMILLFPVIATRFLPGVFVPASRILHGYEAVLAFLAIITWHFYSAHLAAGPFPLDTSIFTGKVSLERMKEEHPKEYERLMAGKGAAPGGASDV